VTTSSTSSSEPARELPRRSTWARLPWAGLLAVLALLAMDRVTFGFNGPWHWLRTDDPNSAAGSRLELGLLVDQPSVRPRVVVAGTSRVIDGLDKKLAQELLPGAAVAKLGYPRFEPFAILALVPDIIAADADAVVLIASEQDTHRPLRLEPVPGASSASLAALWTLLQATDWEFAVENRTALYRFAATSALGLYRFRPDVHLLGIEQWRRFHLDDERIPDIRPRADPFRPVSLWGAERNSVAPAALRSTFDLFPPLTDQWNARIQGGVVQEITRGPHVPVQMALFRRAAERLREAGIEVVILQGVMHPAADDLYDTSITQEFLAFADELERDLGVRFVPRTRMPPFAESDFYDLVHTNHRGAIKITRSMVETLRQTPIEWGPEPR
jgi:hypothetical protein